MINGIDNVYLTELKANFLEVKNVHLNENRRTKHSNIKQA